MTNAHDIAKRIRDYDALDAAKHPDQQNQGILVLLDNSKPLAKLVALWPSVPVAPDPNPLQEVPADTPASYHLRWYWSRFQPDPIETWLACAALPASPYFRKLAQLAIDARMVLPPPDPGAAPWRSKWVVQFLNARGRDIVGVPVQRQVPQNQQAPQQNARA